MKHTDEIDFQSLPVFPSERRMLKEKLEEIIFDLEYKPVKKSISNTKENTYS